MGNEAYTPPDSIIGVGYAHAVGPTLSEGQRTPTGSFDLSSNLRVIASNPGGPITIADGADVCEGATTDVAVVGDSAGTISAKLRGISKILNSVWSSVNGWFVVSANQAGSWVLSAGVALIGKVGIDQTTPGTTNLVSLSSLGRTTLPSVVASGSQIGVLLDRYGRTYEIKPILSNASSAGTPITTNTNTSLIAAPSAGFHLRIYTLWAQNSSATGTWAYFGNGSGVKTFPFYVAQYQPFSRSVNGAWELSSATGLFLNTATTAANIEWYVEYETLED